MLACSSPIKLRVIRSCCVAHICYSGGLTTLYHTCSNSSPGHGISQVLVGRSESLLTRHQQLRPWSRCSVPDSIRRFFLESEQSFRQTKLLTRLGKATKQPCSPGNLLVNMCRANSLIVPSEVVHLPPFQTPSSASQRFGSAIQELLSSMVSFMSVHKALQKDLIALVRSRQIPNWN